MTDYKKSISEAMNLLNNGQVGNAKKILEKLIEEFPNEANSYYCLGMIESMQNNLKSAIYYMKKVLDIAPFQEAYSALAEFYIMRNEPQTALEYVKMALIYNPFNEQTKEILYKLSPNSDFIDKKDYPIDGFYEHSKDCPYLNYIKAYDESVIERKPPYFIESQLTESQKTLLEKTLDEYKSCKVNEGFVVEIPEAIVIAKQSEQTHFISSDGKFLGDIKDSGPELNLDNLPDIIHPCDSLLVLSSHYGGNFYHWLTWTLPRLKMILDAGYKLKDFDKILINYVGFKFQKELIEILNIPKEKIIGTLPKGSIFKVKKAVTASFPEFLKTPKIVVESLRKFLFKSEYLKEDMPSRIYLSRNKSKSRFVLNEDQLQEFIEKYNFTTIYAEDLTISEQIQYFANAEVVLSQHGAGLVNLAFCEPSTKVIEIYNEKLRERLDTSFWKFSLDRNLEHYFMFGEPVGEGQSANMIVDMNKLKEIFELAKI